MTQTDSPTVASQLGDSAPLPKPSERAKLDRSLTSGVAWMGAVKWSSQMLAWACTIIVARLLNPADYGLVGLATVYLGVVTLLSEFGIGTTIVALRTLSRDETAQINTLAILFGAVSFVVSCAAAPLLAAFFNAPQLTWVVIAMSTSFLVLGFRVVPQALMQREMRFKDLAINEGVQAVILSVGSIVFAMLGFRYWTLVISAVLGGIVSTIGVLRLVRVPIVWPRWKEIGHALSFSRQTIIGRLAWYVYQNADFLVAGRVLGREALGAYTVGWTLASTPPDRITTLISRVTPSILSAVQHDAASLRRYLLIITEGIALVTIPATIGLGLVAPNLVPLLLGEKWSAMIAPLMLLAVASAIRSVTPLLAQVLTTTGHNRKTMWVNLSGAVFMPIAFWIGSRWGTIGIASAWVIVYPLVVVVPSMIFACRQIGLAPSTYLKSLWPSVSSAGLMCLTVIAARQAYPATLHRGAALALDIAIGGLTYAATILGMHRERLRVFLQVVRKVKP
jgi:O-antigen/teichoic acid export membrane protein